jgi:hypothetical protein
MKNTILTIILFLAVISTIAQNESILVGVGISENKNSKIAGMEAAQMAEKELATEAKVVIVFASRLQINDNLIKGIASVFPKKIIYGCEGYSPITNHGNFHNQGHDIKSGVAILAIGGEADVTIVHEKTTASNKWENCGKQLGAKLESAVKKDVSGKLLICFGDQHVGEPNEALIKGLYSILPADLPIVGAAAGNSDAKEIVAGEIVNATNVALLLSGDFEVNVACNGGEGDLLDKAKKSFSKSYNSGKENPEITFVFDCGGRRNDMHKQNILEAEYKLMKKIAAATPFFGFYGGGEIGTKANGEASTGVGYSIATATIFNK